MLRNMAAVRMAREQQDRNDLRHANERESARGVISKRKILAVNGASKCLNNRKTIFRHPRYTRKPLFLRKNCITNKQGDQLMKKALLLSVLCGAWVVFGTGCVSVKETPSSPPPTTTRTVTTESHAIRAY
jgi:hypothetical protein